MKKVFSFTLVAAIIGLVISSCNHDSYDGPTTVDPSVEKSIIDSFINAQGLTDLSQDTAMGATGLMSYVINPGNLNRKYADSIPFIYFKVSGTLLNGTPFYTAGSSDLWFNFYTGAALSQDAYYLANSGTVRHYLLTLGEGGSVTFVTPSRYSYANSPVPLSTVTIPANTPLYYSQLTIDSIRSK